MKDIPRDIVEAAYAVQHDVFKYGAPVIASAILAERKRCADWCDQVAFLEWEQGETNAQRALNKARENILSGDDV